MKLYVFRNLRTGEYLGEYGDIVNVEDSCKYRETDYVAKHEMIFFNKYKYKKLNYSQEVRKKKLIKIGVGLL